VLFGGCPINKKCRSHQLDPESVSITSILNFLIEKNAKYIFGAGGKWIWQMGKFSQKGNFSPKRRSHQWDLECVKILLVPYFLIEKNAKYIFGAGGEWIWQMGKFSQKGNFSPYDRELF